MDLSGQVVIITGSSTGIGANVAEHLAPFGAKLVLVARSTDKLQEVKDKCVSKGAKEEDVLCITASVAEEKDIPRIVTETVEKFGKIDHLINNAAVVAFEDLEHVKFETFETVMNTNLRGPIFLTKEAMPYLKKTKGSVVNISSIHGVITSYETSVYAISKAALDHFTRCLALEVASDGVRVNTVRPGFVVTDTHVCHFPEEKKAEMTDMLIKFGLDCQPLGGAVRMHQVAKVIHFLLSDAASASTGQCIAVDNGFLVGRPPGLQAPDQYNTGLMRPEPFQEFLAKVHTSNE